ncbi:hypothetical protein [Pseudomonas synxantha]|uniref:6-phosphogluconolactonase n=1 Tax=Pseudomonas synxantha TaxID=47883 RepID=A0AAU8TK37_9PSED|nr:hypothetical protein [Pseudomonas synxantha]AKA82788.1 hypothetical protein VO64_2242 [Pseudomonas synxantha]
MKPKENDISANEDFLPNNDKPPRTFLLAASMTGGIGICSVIINQDPNSNIFLATHKHTIPLENADNYGTDLKVTPFDGESLSVHSTDSNGQQAIVISHSSGGAMIYKLAPSGAPATLAAVDTRDNQASAVHSVELVQSRDQSKTITVTASPSSQGYIYINRPNYKEKGDFWGDPNTSWYTVPHAHGLLWDSRTQILYALGNATLHLFKFNAEFSKLIPHKLYNFYDFYDRYQALGKQEETEEFADGGHDLYPVTGASRCCFLTTGEHTYTFDLDAPEHLVADPDANKYYENSTFTYPPNCPQIKLLEHPSLFSVSSDLSRQIESGKIDDDSFKLKSITKLHNDMVKVATFTSPDGKTYEGEKPIFVLDKGGIKSISSVAGTDLQVANSTPWFTNKLSYSYNSSELLVVDSHTVGVDKERPSCNKIKLPSGYSTYKARVLFSK